MNNSKMLLLATSIIFNCFLVTKAQTNTIKSKFSSIFHEMLDACGKNSQEYKKKRTKALCLAQNLTPNQMIEVRHEHKNQLNNLINNCQHIDCIAMKNEHQLIREQLNQWIKNGDGDLPIHILNELDKVDQYMF